MDLSKWLTVPEAAALARMSVRTIERAIRSGELRSVRRHGRRLIQTAELMTWLGLSV